MQLTNLPKLAVEKGLIGDIENIRRQIAPHDNASGIAVAAKEHIARKERQIRRSRPSAAARLMGGLRKIERDVTLQEESRKDLFLPAANVRHAPLELGWQVEEIGRSDLGLFRQRHA